MRIVDFEAHFYTQEYIDLLRSRDRPPMQKLHDGGVSVWFEPSVPELWQDHSMSLEDNLLDLTEQRLASMDANGVDCQILSLSGPGTEQLEPEVGTEISRITNDVLARVIEQHPGRFLGFAAVQPAEPEGAARELERCVGELGFKGALVHSHVHDQYLDHERFRPFWDAAGRLGVPVYLHPTIPHAQMIKPYLGYGWALPGPGLGFGHETAVAAVRLAHSGLFDRWPELQVILGHFGEGLSFWLYRLDFDFIQPWMAEHHRSKIEHPPSHYLRENFFHTTSGNFVEPALVSATMAFGIDRILFGSDYPWATLEKAVGFVHEAPLSDEDRAKIFHGNAERLLGL